MVIIKQELPLIVGNKGLALIAALAMMLAGCGADSERKLIAEAQQAIDKGDPNAAVIFLKNALQAAPESAQARFLLGKVLLESGDVSGAEIELRKAQEHKYAMDEVAPLLARCLMARKQYRQVIADYGTLALTDPTRQADLSALVAMAYAYTDQRDKAFALVESTTARAPENGPIRVAQAWLTAGKGDSDLALKILDQTIARNPKEVDAWLLRGDLLLFGKHDMPAALAAYSKVLETRRNDIAVYAKVIGIHLFRKDIDAAKQQLAALTKVAPNHPATAFLAAKIAFAGGQYARAREMLVPVLKLGRDDPEVLQMAAAIELQLNSLVQAEAFLQKALSLSPESSMTRRSLATVLLRKGEPAKAVEALRPLLNEGTTDVQALTLAGEAYMQGRDAKNAEAYFARVAKLKPDDINARTAAALARMAKGDVAAGFADLESIAATDTGALADMALIYARIQQRDIAGALNAIDALDKKAPQKAIPADLRGRVYLLARDSTNARASFEKALARDPVYFPSVAALAQLDVAEGRSDAAQTRLSDFLKADPKNSQALIALAALRARHGADREEVAQLLSRAIEANPNDPAARLTLIEHWLHTSSPRRALEAAQAGLAVLPDEPALLDALGRTQVANGELVQAMNTFGKLALQKPNSVLAQLRLANAQQQANHPEAAERAFRNALAISPDSVAALSGLITLAVRSNKPEKALDVARTVQQRYPEFAVGFMMEGEIHSAFKHWDAAVNAYRVALKKQGTGEAAVRLYAVFVTADRKSEADRFAEEWLKQNPKETRLRSYLAAKALAAADLPDAQRRYVEVVAIDPADLVATNNLAWILAKTRKPGAVATAERALALAPDNPSTLDTLAFALASEGQFGRAVETSMAAIRLAPESPQFRLNLAKIYLQASDKKNGKAQLEELTKVGTKFAAHQEVTDLLKSLPE